MGSCDQVSLKEAMESFKVSVCVLAVVGLCQSAPQVNTNQVVQTVTTQLQPLISDAVARALASISISSSSSSSGFASGSRSGSSFGATSGAAVARGLSEEEELEYNRKLSANAAYDYGYKVANAEKQTYMAHEESRNGQDVQGKYNYVDANGDLVTVTYTANADGYQENREVTPGAVTYRSENIAGPWTGPLAGQTEVEAVARGPVAPRPAPRPAAPAIDQSALIRTILSQLQPQISSAVQTAISSSSRTVSAPVRTVSSSSSSTPQLFAGDNSVRISTPEFNIEY